MRRPTAWIPPLCRRRDRHLRWTLGMRTISGHCCESAPALKCQWQRFTMARRASCAPRHNRGAKGRCARGLKHNWLQRTDCLHMPGNPAETTTPRNATTSVSDMTLPGGGGGEERQTHCAVAHKHTWADHTLNTLIFSLCCESANGTRRQSQSRRET